MAFVPMTPPPMMPDDIEDDEIEDFGQIEDYDDEDSSSYDLTGSRIFYLFFIHSFRFCEF